MNSPIFPSLRCETVFEQTSSIFESWIALRKVETTDFPYRCDFAAKVWKFAAYTIKIVAISPVKFRNGG